MVENTIVPITFEDVAAAAQALADGGQKISILAVREQIGRGSFTTVKKFLERWQQSRNIHDQRPATIPTQLESLWQEACKAANEALGQEREALEQMTGELEQRFEQLQAEAMAAETKRRESEQRLVDKETELLRAYGQIEESKVQRAEIEARLIQTQDQATQERRAFLDRLERWDRHLASLGQSNEQQGQSIAKVFEAVGQMTPQLRDLLSELQNADRQQLQALFEQLSKHLALKTAPLREILGKVENVDRLLHQVRRLQHRQPGLRKAIRQRRIANGEDGL